MPTFLSQTQFANPEGPMGCFQSAFSTDLQLFPWLMAHPEQMVNFNDLMIGQRLSRVEWYSFVPAEQLLLDDYRDGTALMVDIGGNRGNDLEGFKKSCPNAKGDLVVQDLPPVIDDITSLDESIVRMKHDFFTPQPVKGLLAPILHSLKFLPR
jgi:hypothetical protein